MGMKDLPREIMEDILLRLPVKSLLRSKCVCKEWHNIISRPEFAKNHLRHPQTQARIRLCVLDYGEYRYPTDKVVGYLRSTTEFNDNGELLDLGRLDGIYETLNLRCISHFLETCDGLFCVVDSFRDIVLWNPSTRQHNQLPPNPNLSNYDFSSCGCWDGSFLGGKYIVNYYGFGYDYCSDDYKIVAVLIPNYESNMSINVFSLKTNAWRTVELEQHHARVCIASHANGVVFHGAVHWVASFDDYVNDSRPIILAFDFEKEQFREMALPANALLRYSRLKVIEERLCVYEEAEDGIEKWVMEEYGVESSWTTLTSPHSYMCINQFNEELDYQLWGFLNHKHLLQVDFWRIILWDNKENTSYNVMRFEQWNRFIASFFTETLVSPYSLFHAPIISCTHNFK